ncbi:MAG: ABC transporter permease [Vicinamibacteria bacterium]|nr:ABC transporter permease [Vicinamibacteria bacterium]
MSRDILVIAKREFIERVRTKAFVIGTILGPVFMAAIMIVPALMASKLAKSVSITVIDAEGSLRTLVEDSLRGGTGTPEAEKPEDPMNARPRNVGTTQFVIKPAVGADVAAQREAAKKAVLDGKLDVYVVLPQDVLKESKAEYYSKSVTDFEGIRAVDRAIEKAVFAKRIGAAGIDPAQIAALTRPLDLKRLRVSEEGEHEDKGISFFLSLILVMMIYVGTLMWGQIVMTGVIEEKSNRVVEVIVSSTTPRNLLFGKLVGVGGAGLLQFGIWILGLVGVSAASGSLAFLSGLELPALNPVLIAAFPIFFLLGFFLYASLYAAIGSAVNTIQEAQNFIFPVMLPIIMAMVCWPVVMRAPDSTLSVVLSLIPFMTPILMFLRMSVLMPPVWQIALSVVLTSLAIALVIWIAARIYRVGILMYGKPPNFPEMLRWVRHG